MAQVVKLKRTAVAGKVPSTSNLELGELAINTFDGRIFFEKDNGTPSIQHVVTTNSSTTGALDIHGDITASNLYIQGNTTIDGNLTLGGNITIGDSSTDTVSITADLSSSIIPDLGSTFDLGSSSKKWNNLYAVTASADKFIGDGSGLTNLPAVDVSQVATVTSSFDNTSSISVSHNFNTKNVIISVYQSNDTQIVPQSVTLTNNNTADITLSGNHSGYVVVAKGGHIVSGSANDSNQLNGQPGSYYLDYTNFTNIPSGLVSGSSQISFNGITDKPSLISGSSQLNNTTIDGLTILNPTISGSEIALNLPNSSTSAVVISSGLASTFDMRLGTTATNQYAWSTNLSYNGSNWVKDDATRSAWRMNQVVLTTDAASGMEFNYAPPNSTSLENLMTLRRTILDVNVPLDVSGNIVSSGGITGSFQPTGHIIPNANEAYDLGSPTNRFRDLYLSGSTLYLGDTKLSKDVDGNLEVKGSDNSLKTIKVSQLEVGTGNDKITLTVENNKLKFLDKDNKDSNTFRTYVNGLSSYTINHNLDEDYPVVQVYDSLKKQVIPQRIESITSSSLELEFSDVFNGTVVVKK